jgi:hypothetical protein
MPRSPSTYSLPPGTTPQVPNTVISSSMFTAFADDVAQTFNTVQPIAYGGTGSSDLKLNDTDFGIKDNGDPTKIGQFNASNLPTATTRTYDLPYYSGTLGLVSDIRGQIYGLTLSNNVTDPTNDINIATGAAVDSSGAASMLLSSALTKRLDAVWAVGTNQGMNASGSALTNTTYHIFLIRRPDTGVVDVAADTSVTGSNLAANTNVAYTQTRRIGSIIRKSDAIVLFTQIGNYFQYTNVQADVSVTNLGTAATLYNLTVPANIPVRAKFRVLALNASVASIKVSSPFEADTFDPGTGDITMLMPVASVSGAATMEELTSVNGQLRARSSTANTTLRIATYGYTDTRAQY